MRSSLLVSAALSLLAASSALGRDRPVTDDERKQLTAALTAEGCSGGTMELDEGGRFEVDDAKCADGRQYDLTFDASFKLVNKDLDD